MNFWKHNAAFTNEKWQFLFEDQNYFLLFQIRLSYSSVMPCNACQYVFERLFGVTLTAVAIPQDEAANFVAIVYKVDDPINGFHLAEAVGFVNSHVVN